MGVLRNESTGSAWALVSRQLIGRSPVCQLRLGSELSSQEHAVLWWEGGRWWLRDLGSTNGTSVDGRRLQGGEQVELDEGAQLVFGEVSEAWLLEGGRPPQARAVPLDGGAAAEAADGLLGLPSDESPELVLHRRVDGRWVLDREEGSRSVGNLEVLTVHGRSWRLHLPEPVQATLGGGRQELRLPAVAMEFLVSRNEEEVELRVSNEHASVELPSRSHSYALLQLARARLEDAELEPGERGWVDREELCRQLAIDRLTLNTLIHRARRQLAEAGVQDVGALVERRSSGGELRLGVADVTVESLRT